MIPLIVIGSILLLIVILLMLSVTIDVNFEHDVFDYKIKYLFFTIISDPESPRKKKKREKKEKRKKRREQKKADKARKKMLRQAKKRKKSSPPAKTAASGKSEASPSSGEKKSESKTTSSSEPEEKKPGVDFDLIKRVLTGAKPHVKRIFKRIRIKDVYIDAVVGGEDAAKVAINYGVMNMFINGVLCLLNSLVELKVGEVNIEADFDKQKTDLFAHARLKLRLSTLLHSGIWGFLAVFKELHADTEDITQKSGKSGKAA